MNDQDLPADDAPADDAPASEDVWARLRRLEDLERGPVPAERSAAPPPDRVVPPGQRVSPPDPDHTTVMGTSPAAARPPDDPGVGRQYYVASPTGGAAGPAGSPRPGAAPVASSPVASSPAAQARAQEQYRAAAQAPAAPTRAPQRTAPSPAAPDTPGGRDRGPSRLRPKAKWFRPKLRWIFLYLPLLVILLLGGVLFWGWNTFNGLYRVELGDALVPATGSAVNYLIVGSDSREGIEGDTPNVGVIGTGTEVKGRRSDTIIVLRVDGDRAEMMSIPRDLWVTNVATGKKGRINGTYAQGPDNLVRSVTANLGIPINRYIEVDFVSFAGMVDAVGGITINFPHPVIDANSGLKIATAGDNQLDGTQALAYVRSRHYTEEIDGKPVLEPTADLGRQVRQQNFIRTVLKTVGENRNPLTLAKVGGAAAKGVRVDSEVGFFDLVGLARQLGGANPETLVLPTVGANKGGASVLELKNAEALPILAEFGAGGS